MMFRGRLLFAAGYIALLVHVFFAAAAAAANNQNPQQRLSSSSSCGDMRNINFPFRLKADPHDNCGIKSLELECGNNRTVLYLYSGKYYVQAINYNNSTIRLVDVGIQRNNCSSLPLHSLTYDNVTDGEICVLYSFAFAVFVSCEKPLKSSPLYIDTNNSSCSASCENGVGGGGGVNSSSNSNVSTSCSSSFSSTKKYSYVVVGDSWSDVGNLCSVDMMFPTRRGLPNRDSRSEDNISSFLDVHNLLADGFELFWYFHTYEECGLQAHCFNDSQTITRTCRKNSALHGIWAFLDGLPYFFKGRWRLYYYDYRPLVHGIIGVIISPRILYALCAFAFLIRKFRRRHLSMFDSIEGYLRSQNHLMPISYSYSEIKKMTKSFKDKLGEGGYGSVYKGKLRSGHLVAIKILSKPKADGQEFINEVATIGRIHHVNVVQLIGYCAERSKRALLYDFMPNGSLEKYIFSHEGNISLSCKKMFEISLGVARGIEYLHRGCDMQILHFDIKPHNILLDENFTPKVSDFGLAKLYSTDDSIVSLTAARGTMGYMAPELFYKNIGGISYKADVYSFGMLLMEMAGRRRNLNASVDQTSQIYFPSWIFDQFKEGKEIEMGETCEEERVMVKKMVIVSLWCIQMKPSARSSMNKVVEMLEGDIEHLQMPPKPFLCPQEMPVEDHGVDMNPTELPTLLGECINSITLDVSEP